MRTGLGPRLNVYRLFSLLKNFSCVCWNLSGHIQCGEILQSSPHTGDPDVPSDGNKATTGDPDGQSEGNSEGTKPNAPRNQETNGKRNAIKDGTISLGKRSQSSQSVQMLILTTLLTMAHLQSGHSSLKLEPSYLSGTDQPTWFHHGLLVVSISLAQPGSARVRDAKLHYFPTFNQIPSIAIDGPSSRHATQLRVLLLIAGIEPNPGPAIAWSTLKKDTLLAVLTELKADDAEYELPSLKDDIVAAILVEDLKAARLALKFVQQCELAAVIPSTISDPDAHRVISLPAFSEKNSKVWFDQIAALLANSSATARKNSLIGALPTDVILQAGAKLTEDFDEIKVCILSHYGETDESRLRKLLEQQHLGDRKPSSALRELQRLAPGSTDLIKLRFMEMLPESVRVVLAALDATFPLDKAAEVADKMMEQLHGSSSIRAITETTTTDADVRTVINQISTEVSKLASDFQRLKQQRPTQFSDRSRSRRPTNFRGNRSSYRSNSSRGARTPNNSGRLCFYHFRFGSSARNCQNPCGWNSLSDAERQRHDRTRSSNRNAPGSSRPSSERN